METNPKPKEDRILAFLARDNSDDAITFFFKFFGAQSLPRKPFLMSVLAELNRLKVYHQVFEVLKKVESWFPKDPDLVKSEKVAKKNFYFYQVEKANKIVSTAQDRLHRFTEEAKSLDKLYREKLLEENQNAINGLYREAIKIFEGANELRPDGFEALMGISHAYGLLGEKEQAEKINQKLAVLSQDIMPEDLSKEESDAETLSIQIEEEIPTSFDLSPLESLFEEQKFGQVMDVLERILRRNPDYVPALLFKLKVHVELREFKKAEVCIEKAMRVDGSNKKVMEIRVGFQDQKFRALVKGGGEFLKKGIQLGPTLGRDLFLKAVECLDQALPISPGDIPLLDQLYTALLFLGEKERARKVREDILINDPRYVPTYDRFQARSLCFIADFAYEGDENAIEDFRVIRRELLLRNAIGRRVVTSYVRLAPGIVKGLRSRKFPSRIFRWVLNPVRIIGKIVRASYENRLSISRRHRNYLDDPY